MIERQQIQVLMVAHGSPQQAANAAAEEYRQQFSKRCPLPVNLCFLEFAAPDLAAGLRETAAAIGKGGKVLILPLFLGAGGHVKNDLPAAISLARRECPGVDLVCASVFAPHANLIALLDERIREALLSSQSKIPLAESIVLLVGRGSSDPDSNSEVARAAYLLSESPEYKSVEYAYQAVAHPSVSEGFERAARLGASQVIVALDLLFTGWVEDKILAAAKAKSLEYGIPVIFTQPLGSHPFMLDISEMRLNQALEGVSGMTCDLCKYRLPMAGFEHEQGKPLPDLEPHSGENSR